MRSNEFIDRLANKGYKKADAKIIAKDVFNTIGEMLVDGETIKIPRFGVFSIRNRHERVGTSPLTHEQIIVPEMRTVKFKASNTLKDAVKGENFAFSDLSDLDN